MCGERDLFVRWRLATEVCAPPAASRQPSAAARRRRFVSVAFEYFAFVTHACKVTCRFVSKKDKCEHEKTMKKSTRVQWSHVLYNSKTTLLVAPVRGTRSRPRPRARAVPLGSRSGMVAARARQRANEIRSVGLARGCGASHGARSHKPCNACDNQEDCCASSTASGFSSSPPTASRALNVRKSFVLPSTGRKSSSSGSTPSIIHVRI